MARFLGEYTCKIDTKGRMVLPAGILRQMDETRSRTIYLNRGFEKCLVIYPSETWESIAEELEKLNIYNTRSRSFIRYMMRGLSHVELDKTNRIRLNERLLEYAGIKKDLIVVGHLSRIELWDPEEYDKVLSNEPAEFAKITEEVMAGKISEELKGFSFN